MAKQAFAHVIQVDHAKLWRAYDVPVSPLADTPNSAFLSWVLMLLPAVQQDATSLNQPEATTLHPAV